MKCYISHAGHTAGGPTPGVWDVLITDRPPFVRTEVPELGFLGTGEARECGPPGGYKMKWHNLGPGQIQLRLPVMAGQRAAFLCEAYVKASAAVDQRKIARFKTHMNIISQGCSA